jgi:hypothetical protein
MGVDSWVWSGDHDRGTIRPEKRRAPRHPAAPSTACVVAEAGRTGPRYRAWVRDLSATGLCLLMPARFAAGTLLAVELRNEKTGFSLSKSVQVAQADICCPNDAWLHGCAFVGELTTAELQGLDCAGQG